MAWFKEWPAGDANELEPHEHEALAFLLPLSPDYPGIEHWFCRRVVPGLRDGTRLLLRVERDGQLAGLGIAKKDCGERKICTVRVSPTYFGRGIGVRLFDHLLRWVDDDKPHLTVSERRLPVFNRIFDSYGFRMTSVQNGRYTPSSIELGYNEPTVRISEAVAHPLLGAVCQRGDSMVEIETWPNSRNFQRKL
jgi:GNAT superfamily N-acetyltransferase